jgi:hypothetical protein
MMDLERLQMAEEVIRALEDCLTHNRGTLLLETVVKDARLRDLVRHYREQFSR